MGWHEDFEDLADNCPEDIEEQWQFEQPRQTADALPVTDDPPW
jgi:hypothetical protein